MAENSKTSIRKRLYKEFRKAFPGKRVFVKRGTGFAAWIVFIWEYGQARNATATVVESSHSRGQELLEDTIDWLGTLE